MEEMMNAAPAGEKGNEQITTQPTQQPAQQPTLEGGKGTGNPAPTGENAAQAKGQPEKTFTQAELDAIVQKRIADVKRTADQRSLMTLAEREAELSKREQAMLHKELKASAVAALEEKKLPPELAEVMGLTTEEDLPEQIAKVDEVYHAVLERHMRQFFKGKSPVQGAVMQQLSPQEEAFNKGLHGELVRGSRLNLINGKPVSKGYEEEV